jgi:hypothetical protein
VAWGAKGGNGIRDGASGTTKHGHDDRGIDVEALLCKGRKLEQELEGGSRALFISPVCKHCF